MSGAWSRGHIEFTRTRDTMHICGDGRGIDTDPRGRRRTRDRRPARDGAPIRTIRGDDGRHRTRRTRHRGGVGSGADPARRHAPRRRRIRARPPPRRAWAPHADHLRHRARLTGRRVRGLGVGGDDYVTKPFSLDEVVRACARRARRTGGSGSASRRTFADVTLDDDLHEVRRNGVVVDLTVTEYNLLRFLMDNPRRVVSRRRSSITSGTTTSTATTPSCHLHQLPPTQARSAGSAADPHGPGRRLQPAAAAFRERGRLTCRSGRDS